MQKEMGNCSSGIKPVVDKLFIQDGDTAYVDEYAKSVGMDENNKRVLKIFKEQGISAGYKALGKGPNNEPLSYAESRAMYG
jgi:hypothetical protein